MPSLIIVYHLLSALVVLLLHTIAAIHTMIAITANTIATIVASPGAIDTSIASIPLPTAYGSPCTSECCAADVSAVTAPHIPHIRTHSVSDTMDDASDVPHPASSRSRSFQHDMIDAMASVTASAKSTRCIIEMV